MCVLIPLAVVALAAPRTTVVMTGDRAVSVRAFGAKGDGRHDDTDAFRHAIAFVAKTGGVVHVPPTGPGLGYVLTKTVTVPAGVALMGCPSGFGNNAWAAFAEPEHIVVGSKILARPSPDQYSGRNRQPLFALPGGGSVRGLWIFYDRQPWPSDEDFTTPRSRFYYASFEEARERFIREHVKPYGPTFYVTGPNVVIEDIVCDRYYDFFVQPRSAKTFVDRVALYGYRCGFAYIECLDVNRLTRVHLVPNVGPACPGKAVPGRTYSWIYGIVTSSPENVGVHVGRSDGYVFSDLMFFGVHTAIRLGASREFPMRDPVTGTDFWEDPAAGMRSGFASSYAAQGPWGTVMGLMADQCVIGVHLVWPTPLTNRMSNVAIHTALFDGRTMPGSRTDGRAVPAQAAILVESSHVTENNIGIAPVLMLTNLSVGSFRDAERFAGAAADAGTVQGRAVWINGDVTLEVTNAQVNHPYTVATLCGFGPAAARSSVRIRGLVTTGAPQPDFVSTARQEPAAKPDGG